MNANKNSELPRESAIAPNLKSTIESLDLELESEIDRYLSHRYKQQPLRLAASEPSEAIETSLTINLQSTEVLAENLNGNLSEPITPEPEIESDPEKRSAFLDYLLSPATIISLLFFILGTGLLGSIFLPKILAQLFNKEETPTAIIAKNQDEEKSDLAKDEETVKLTEVSKIPDYNRTAASEVSTSSPEKPTETKAPQSGDLATVLLPPSLREEAAPLAVKLPENMNLEYYYVMTKYTENNSLKKAQKFVKDAYLINLDQGMAIILAAYARQEDAVLFTKQLQQKGLSSFIYHPQAEMKKDSSR